MKAEAYLVKHALFTFDLPNVNEQKNRHIEFTNLSNSYSLTPVNEFEGSDVSLASKLQTVYSEETTETKKNISLVLNTRSIYYNGCDDFFGSGGYAEQIDYLQARLSSAIFRSLLMSLGDQMKLRLELRNSEVELPSVNPTSMTTATLNSNVGYEPIMFSGNTNNFPQRWAEYWNSPLKMKFSVRVSIIVCGDLVLKTSDDLDVMLREGLDLNNEQESIPKKLLEEKIATNITIITPDGSKIECHKSFLIAQSSVFETMLTGGKYKEGESQEIKMADMTANGVKALLAYLYYRGLEKPVKDLKVAVELLRAANKYDISKLEKAVKTIILQKPIEWFDIATTIQLFFFSKNVEQLVMVKLKSLQILKSKRAEVTASNEYTQLFEDVDDVNRVAARELSTALINM